MCMYQSWFFDFDKYCMVMAAVNPIENELGIMGNCNIFLSDKSSMIPN